MNNRYYIRETSVLCAVLWVSPVTLFLTIATALGLSVALCIAHAMHSLAKWKTMQLALVSGIWQPFYTVAPDTYSGTAQTSLV